MIAANPIIYQSYTVRNKSKFKKELLSSS